MAIISTLLCMGSPSIGSIQIRPISDAIYIHIPSFNATNIAATIQRELSNFVPPPPATYMIDLRNNRGGYLHEAVKTCALFTHATDLLTITMANGDKQIITRPSQHAYVDTNQIIVLTNTTTASAAEACLSILHTAKKTITYGQSTYGKTTITTTTTPAPYQSFDPHSHLPTIPAILPENHLTNDQLRHILSETRQRFDPTNRNAIQ